MKVNIILWMTGSRGLVDHADIRSWDTLNNVKYVPQLPYLVSQCAFYFIQPALKTQEAGKPGIQGCSLRQAVSGACHHLRCFEPNSISNCNKSLLGIRLEMRLPSKL